MYCKYCGSKNDDGARFCRDCGRAMTGSPPNAGSAAPAHTGVTPGAVQASTEARRWMWVALGAGLLVVLFFVGFIVLDFRATSEIADPIVDTRPPAPDNAKYVWDNATTILSWDASKGAEYYNIYHDDLFDDNCRLRSDGTLSFCDELATNNTGTSYVHTEPDEEKNHYWITACNRNGCSDIDSNNPAEFIDTRPARPSNVQAQFVQNRTQIQVSWDSVPDAEDYKIYYDDFFGDNCRVSRNGATGFCDLSASDIRQTSYLHTNPDRRKNYYWVVACNSAGCSDVESKNPVVVEDASPSTASPSPEQSGPLTESDMSRRSFEASTPSGYTRVSLTDKEIVWGIPERFTTDSSLGAVAYILLGSVKGCSFADEELDRSSIVYVKGERLGRLSNYESQEVCRMASSAWDTRWDGIRITHLHIFDESSPTNAREYVYDPDGMQYIEASSASGGPN